MATRRKPTESTSKRRPPATTPEARENQMVALAFDEAERQIREGRASSQLLTHFLKLGATREKLEQEKISHENALLQARAEGLASQKNIEKLYGDALKAMKTYGGQEPDETYDD